MTSNQKEQILQNLNNQNPDIGQEKIEEVIDSILELGIETQKELKIFFDGVQEGISIIKESLEIEMKDVYSSGINKGSEITKKFYKKQIAARNILILSLSSIILYLAFKLFI